MTESSRPLEKLPQEMISYYQRGGEAGRLAVDRGQLELARTQDLLQRFLPPPPAVVLDVGGGPGIYSCWLAKLGYEVHLVDPVPLHLEQAREASQAQTNSPIASFTVGDARDLDIPDSRADAVLLLGPLYHLTERNDRLTVLREARRVSKEGGLVLAAVISRFASLFDGLLRGFLADPEFIAIVQRDLAEGQHRNPSGKRGYFTTAFFHHPEELKAEFEEAGLHYLTTLAVEGPGWMLGNFDEHWRDDARRQWLLAAVRSVEEEASILGMSGHLMAIARKNS